MSPVATVALIRAKLSQGTRFFLSHCLDARHRRYKTLTAVLLIDSYCWELVKNPCYFPSAQRLCDVCDNG